VREHELLLMIGLRDRRWWRNLRGGAPVTVRLGGRALSGRDAMVLDAQAVRE
jgi:hypothetical protein